MKTYALTLVALAAGICFGMCVGELALAERRIDVLEVKRWMLMYVVAFSIAVTEIIINNRRSGDGNDDG